MLDELSLGKSSGQRRHNVNVISYTADPHKFRAEIAADRCQISVHPRPHVASSQGLRSLVLKMM